MGDCFFKRCEPTQSADFFATPPKAVKALCKAIKFRQKIIEPCCGQGHISRTLEEHGYTVESSDIIYRGFGKEGSYDFLKSTKDELNGFDIITNPPFNQAQEIIMHALSNTDMHAKIAMLLRLTFLPSKRRKILFDTYPLTALYVFRSRIGCAPNGEFKVKPNGELYVPSAIDYAWFIWDKAKFDEGPPKIYWLE